MNIARRLCLMLAVCTTLAAGVAGAEPPEARSDARAMIQALRLDLDAVADGPSEPGVEGTLRDTHRLLVKPRLSRMRSRLKEADSDRLWNMPPVPIAAAPQDEERQPPDPALLLAPWIMSDQWTGFVHRLASVFTEFSQIAKGYRGKTVSGRGLLQRWLRANPEPTWRGLTAAGSQAARVQRLISWYIGQGKLIPLELRNELREWRALEILEIQQREMELQRWREERRAADAEIEAAVQWTKQALAAEVQAWVLRMDTVRGIVEAAQAAEEQRLALLLPAEGEARTQALAALATLAAGRTLALASPDDPPGEWATRVRQRWVAPRAALLASGWLTGP